MRLHFELAELGASGDSHEQLNRIVGTIADGWHEWSWPPPEDEIFSEYFATRPQHAELAMKSFGQAIAYPDSATQTVFIVDHEVQGDTSENRYPLSRALDYLAQPLHILVENEVSDGHFYLRYIRVADPELADRFDQARAPVMFDQGGGNMEVLNLVGSRTARFAKYGLRPRLIVLVDSDARYPGHVPSETRRLMDACKERGIPVHASLKRSQENYIPDEALESCATADVNLRSSVDFILRLNATQRDHFPIKAGLPEKLADGERNLYLDLPHQRGRNAKLKRAAEYFRVSWTQQLSYENLSARGCAEEIEQIAEFIRREL